MVKVNIVGWDNGGGLGKDISILIKALETSGISLYVNGFRLRDKHRMHNRMNRVIMTGFRETGARLGRFSFDVNLFLERIFPRFLSMARHNALIPNPEWLHQDTKDYLQEIDIVLCKTRLTENIFSNIGCPTRFVGFSAFDMQECDIAEKNEQEFVHFAGKNPLKGTQRLLELWLKHPDWPTLTVFQSPETYDGTPNSQIKAENINHILKYLPQTILQRTQNTFRVHLCPTEAEGFGHGIVEAMSCSALVVTTDAPPMNEFVTRECGILVSYTEKVPTGFNYRYIFDERALEEAIDRIEAMPKEAKEEMGSRARQWYMKNDNLFKKNITAVLLEVATS